MLTTQAQQAVDTRDYLVSKGISEDIAQEVAIGILRSPVPIRHPKSWGWRRAQWLKLDAARTAALDEKVQAAARTSDRKCHLTPLRYAEARQELQDKALILWLHAFGMSYARIAQELGIPKGTVMSRLHSARQKLKGVR